MQHVTLGAVLKNERFEILIIYSICTHRVKHCVTAVMNSRSLILIGQMKMEQRENAAATATPPVTPTMT